MASGATQGGGHYDTIILGAGMAGLSCASRLFNNQKYRASKRLLVLEARDRVGGRIQSVHVNNCRLDLGANWIHGIGTEEVPNPLVTILPHKKYRQLAGTVAFQAPEPSRAPESPGRDAAQPEGWVKVDIPDLPGLGSIDSGASRSSRVIPASVAAPMMGALWGMIGALHETAHATTPDAAKRMSMLQAMSKSEPLQAAFRTVPDQYRRTLAGMPQFVENMEAAPLAAQSAEHSEGQPGMSLLEFAIDDFDGDQVFLQDGYTAVVDEVAKDLIDAGIVRTGVDVLQVAREAGHIRIETSAGTYTANDVVCTLPLGVLQYHHRDLFVPALPPDKKDAISELGFGTLDKVFLVYDRPWWNTEPYWSAYKDGIVKRPLDAEDPDDAARTHGATYPDSFMGFTEELAGIEIDADGTTSAGARCLSLINLHNLTGFPVLSAFVSCANATVVESLTDAKAGEMLHRAMTAWLGIEPPKPDAVHVTKWAQDQYSRGSYSHMITGVSETAHRVAFQRPVLYGDGATLRFAGEHTSRNHFATVHGALLSGWREADDILSGLAG